MNKSNRKNMSKSNSKSKGKGCGCLTIFLVLAVIGMIANACDPDSDTDADIAEPASGIERAIESDNAGTDAADSEADDTVYFETQIAPETEIQETLPETEPAETEPETEAVEESTFEWDTVAESVSESESNWIEPVVEVIPETEPAIVIVHEDSSMTPELIDQLEGVAFFWAPTGNKVHIDPTCRTFKKEYTFAGTLSEAQSVRTDGWCGICSDEHTTTNWRATSSALAECYTYDDFLNGIPAAAFED